MYQREFIARRHKHNGADAPVRLYRPLTQRLARAARIKPNGISPRVGVARKIMARRAAAAAT